MSMERFEPGEIAIVTYVNEDLNQFGLYSGMECEILSHETKLTNGRWGYRVDVGIDPSIYGYEYWACNTEFLKKKKPPAEFEAGSWEKCVWNPFKQKEELEA